MNPLNDETGEGYKLRRFVEWWMTCRCPLCGGHKGEWIGIMDWSGEIKETRWYPCSRCEGAGRVAA